MKPVLKLILEMGPLVVFFIANGKFGILNGTLIFMGATAVALAVSYAMLRTIPIMPLVSGAFVMVFGGLTVILENDIFIKIKPTIVNLCFAGILSVGLMTGRMFIKLILEAAIQLTERGWLLLTRAWIGFFLVLAVMNEIVWRTFTTDMWVKFKVFGVMPMTVLFSLALIPVILKHTVQTDTAPRDPEADKA